MKGTSFLLLTIFLIISCGKSSQDETVNENTPTEGELRAPQYVNARSDYFFESDCTADQSRDRKATSTYYISKYDLYKNAGGKRSISFKNKYFMDSNCRFPAMDLNLDAEITSNRSAVSFRAKLQQAQIRSTDNSVTAQFNRESFCGLTNWITDGFKDVYLSSCFPNEKLENDFYVDSRANDDLTLFSCNKNERLNDKCNKTSYRLVHSRRN